MAEIWYSGGRTSRPAKSWSANASSSKEIREIQQGLTGLVGAFGALGQAAYETGTKFSDAARALEALSQDFPDVAMKEPDACAFCGAEADRVKHSFDSRFMQNVPIWTRVCGECMDEPLCSKHPWGVHERIVRATDESFDISVTVVVDLNDLETCGYCQACALPLRNRDGRWRYWTAAERAKFL